jgi:glycosidase
MAFPRIAASVFFLAGALAVACGNSDATNRDYGEPPDPNGFNPGNGNTDPYGSGSGPKTGASKVECPADLKRCGHTFTYPSNDEGSVEVRGDWDGQSSWDTGVPMAKRGGQWTAEVPLPVGKAVSYKFWVDGIPTPAEDQPKTTDPQGNVNNTFAGATCAAPTCSEEGELPEGVFDWRDSVIYFVFVDRFLDGNPGNNGSVPGVEPIANYLGGDWAGVTSKIKDGYFTDLGVNTLWVTVPFNNPKDPGKGTGGDNHQYSGYHGYWPDLGADATQLSTEEHFGSLGELKTLINEAHEKNIKVLFDFAMVHVHKNSKVFENHADWFWPNNKDGHDCVCGQGCSWDGDPMRCWFTDYLPHWNYTNPQARDWSVLNAVSWVKETKVDGFRADAIKHVDISWLNALRAKLKTDVLAEQNPQQRFYMVGETYDFGNRDLLKSFIDPGTKLDGQFDFPLRKLLVESVLMRTTPMSALSSFMDTNDYFYGTNAVMSTFLGNHDLPRIIHVAQNQRPWGDDQGSDGKNLAWQNQPQAPSEAAAYERVANGFAVLFTNRGAPLIYYGDEIGLPGAGDPDNRRMMKWDGYSSNQTALRDRIKLLADIRAKHPALRRGTRSTINADNDTWVFSRETTGDTVYVAINRSDAAKEVSGLPAGPLNDEVTSTVANGPTVSVPARQTRIFTRK